MSTLSSFDAVLMYTCRKTPFLSTVAERGSIDPDSVSIVDASLLIVFVYFECIYHFF